MFNRARFEFRREDQFNPGLAPEGGRIIAWRDAGDAAKAGKAEKSEKFKEAGGEVLCGGKGKSGIRSRFGLNSRSFFDSSGGQPD